MTTEEIVRKIYGNNYTIDNVKRIEKAVVDEQIKKEIEKDVRDQEHSN